MGHQHTNIRSEDEPGHSLKGGCPLTLLCWEGYFIGRCTLHYILMCRTFHTLQKPHICLHAHAQFTVACLVFRLKNRQRLTRNPTHMSLSATWCFVYSLNCTAQPCMRRLGCQTTARIQDSSANNGAMILCL
jgi:hypothetical protein